MSARNMPDDVPRDTELNDLRIAAIAILRHDPKTKERMLHWLNDRSAWETVRGLEAACAVEQLMRKLTKENGDE